MEKMVVVTIVFVSIGFLIWHLVKSFESKGSYCRCYDCSKCDRDKYEY